MFVEGPCEVDIEQLLVVDSQAHHPTSELEVAEVIRVDIREAVRLERGTYSCIKTNTRNTVIIGVCVCVCVCGQRPIDYLSTPAIYKMYMYKCTCAVCSYCIVT